MITKEEARYEYEKRQAIKNADSDELLAMAADIMEELKTRVREGSPAPLHGVLK